MPKAAARKTIRKKKYKSTMEMIEDCYGKDFGVPNDEKVWRYFEEIGYPSLSALLRGHD